MSINQLLWAAPSGNRRAKEDETKAKGSIDEKDRTEAKPSSFGNGRVSVRLFERSFSKRPAVTIALRINSAACSFARWTSATSGKQIWLARVNAVWKISVQIFNGRTGLKFDTAEKLCRSIGLRVVLRLKQEPRTELEVVRWATTLSVDLRDLTEKELAYLERVSVKLVQKWRTEGTGPTYRNKAGIRYALKDYWDWRRKGRQTMTSQGWRRGNRRLDEL